MSFNYRRFNAILQKETKHILRDPFTLMLALFVPLMIVLILGNSIEFNLKEISTVVVDHDHTKESTELIHTFNSSNYFKTYFKDSPDEAFREILRENARMKIGVPFLKLPFRLNLNSVKMIAVFNNLLRFRSVEVDRKV